MTSKYVSILNYWNSQLFFKCKSTAMNHSPSEAVSSLKETVSSGFLNTRKLMKEAECFYCIWVFRNPDGTRSPSLWNGFSKGSNSLALNTKAKQRSCLYLVFPFFCFLTLLKTDLLVSVMEDVSVIFTSAAFQWETVALCIALLCYNFE